MNLFPRQLLAAAQHRPVVLRLVWNLARYGLLRPINIREHPEFYQLASEGEKVFHLARVESEELLLRWMNHHVRAYLAAHPEEGRVPAEAWNESMSLAMIDPAG